MCEELRELKIGVALVSMAKLQRCVGQCKKMPKKCFAFFAKRAKCKKCKRILEVIRATFESLNRKLIVLLKAREASCNKNSVKLKICETEASPHVCLYMGARVLSRGVRGC